MFLIFTTGKISNSLFVKLIRGIFVCCDKANENEKMTS